MHGRGAVAEEVGVVQGLHPGQVRPEVVLVAGNAHGAPEDGPEGIPNADCCVLSGEAWANALLLPFINALLSKRAVGLTRQFTDRSKQSISSAY